MAAYTYMRSNTEVHEDVIDKFINNKECINLNSAEFSGQTPFQQYLQLNTNIKINVLQHMIDQGCDVTQIDHVL